MNLAYVGLGANLREPARQVRDALLSLAGIPDLTLHRVSRFYRSSPMGPADQPEYCNAVCELSTPMSPQALLQQLISIEQRAGRVRGDHKWGPRLIDLDILHVDGQVLDEPGLHVPHPGLSKRNFVVLPLNEIRPDLEIPGVGRLSSLAESMDKGGLEFWSGADKNIL